MIYKYFDNKLSFIKVNLKKVVYITAIALVLTLISTGAHQNGFNADAEYTIDRMPAEEKISVITRAHDSSFSQVKLIQMLEDLNVRFPHIVMAQAIIESGHFQSNIFKTNHNLFGMKQARSRCTTAKGTNLGHAYYDNWKESVYDYAFFQSRYLHDLKNEEQYLKYLDRNYAEVRNYDIIIKRVIKNEGLLEIFN